MLIIRGFFFFFGSHLHQERFHGTQQNLLLWNHSNQTTAITLSIVMRFGRIRTVRRSMILNEKFKPTLFPETRLIDFREKDETLGLKTNSDFSNFLEGLLDFEIHAFLKFDQMKRRIISLRIFFRINIGKFSFVQHDVSLRIFEKNKFNDNTRFKQIHSFCCVKQFRFRSRSKQIIFVFAKRGNRMMYKRTKLWI